MLGHYFVIGRASPGGLLLPLLLQLGFDEQKFPRYLQDTIQKVENKCLLLSNLIIRLIFYFYSK